MGPFLTHDRAGIPTAPIGGTRSTTTCTPRSPYDIYLKVPVDFAAHYVRLRMSTVFLPFCYICMMSTAAQRCDLLNTRALLLLYVEVVGVYSSGTRRSSFPGLCDDASKPEPLWICMYRRHYRHANKGDTTYIHTLVVLPSTDREKDSPWSP